MVYKWQGYNFSVSANIVGAQCEQIEKEKGTVTAADLVDAARSETSALHPLFEWDDAVAAEKYRCYRAGVVLSCLKIVVNDTKDETPVKAFVNIKPENGGRAEYMNINTALKHEEHRNTVLSNALRDLQIVKFKYATLTELSEVWAAIDKAIGENK